MLEPTHWRGRRRARPRLRVARAGGLLWQAVQAMPKKPEKVTLDHNFEFASDADLAEQITAFKAEHPQRLALDSKRSLGSGKVRVTFRVIVEARGKGR